MIENLSIHLPTMQKLLLWNNEELGEKKPKIYSGKS